MPEYGECHPGWYAGEGVPALLQPGSIEVVAARTRSGSHLTFNLKRLMGAQTHSQEMKAAKSKPIHRTQ